MGEKGDRAGPNNWELFRVACGTANTIRRDYEDVGLDVVIELT